MTDRESVITHLQIIHTWAEFARERDLQFFTPKHLKDIAEWTDDTLELLKEQEAVKPIRKLAYTKQGWFCGNCDNRLNRNGKYCSFCGKPVLWEGR